MYQPNNEIIRSAERDFQFDGNAFGRSIDQLETENKRSYDNYLAEQERTYKETEDLYDIQKRETDSLNDGLKGLSGQDQLYYQQSIIEERDKLASIYKNIHSKGDYRSPEIQAELYALKTRLSDKRNAIDTFHQEAQAVNSLLKDNPSTKTGEVTAYLNAQMQLPPDKRDKNIVEKVQTDPLFFNAYDYAASVIKGREKSNKEIQKENKDLILNYDAEFTPDLEEYDAASGEFKFNPSDSLVEDLLAKDKRFYNAMKGMIPATQARKLVDSGNDGLLEDAVKDQAKEYLKTVKGFEAKLKQTGKTVKSWNYYKPTSTDSKKKDEEQEVAAIQQRLNNSDIRAFDDYLGTHWKEFQYEFDDERKPIAIIASYEGDHPSRKGKKITKKQIIDIDPEDKGSVAQALNIIKRFNYTDKDNVTAKPLSAPETKKKTKGRFDVSK
jgi:hypothetical protein